MKIKHLFLLWALFLMSGYAGGMPNYIRHHSQRGVQHYQKVVETAAKYEIAIDAQEPIKETGIRRTWPNMMTREGARGMEWNGDNSQTYIKTTIARQIANWVIIYSPLQMACDLIENYEDHPAFQFFRDFDADCDWSEALAGEIGDYIVIARRAGEKFFLEPGGTTAPDKTCYRIEKIKVTSSDTLTIEMAADGGQAVSFIPVE